MSDRRVVDGQPELGTGDGDEPIVAEAKFRTDQRDLERGCLAGIPDECVRQAMRERIHRAGDRHTLGLVPPSSEVLHGGLQSGDEYLEPGSDF
jgi:hypothetical protein